MDHLPHPQDSAFPRVRVPYYDKYKYDCGTFTDYPIRCGFDKSKFKWGDFRTVPSSDHDSFFQAWLFFGLIHEFFRGNLDDFIDHQEQRVSTARLSSWAAKWQQSLALFSLSKRMAECERVIVCLREVRQMISYLDDRVTRETGLSDLSEEVALSIIVLGITLDEVRSYRKTWILNFGRKDQDSLYAEVGGWHTSEFARKRLEAAGWCKSEVSRLETYMFSTGMLYCGSMRSYGRAIDHSRCSEHRCAAEDIDEETYETAHAEGCRRDRCEHDGPLASDLACALDGRSFPVIGLTKSETTSNIRISVLPYRKSMAYTAISHVWADGLGNPHGNTLPQCQILRLYQLIQFNNHTSERRTAWMRRLLSSKTNTVYIWIDTLCIPLNKELRKKAISLMHTVYNMAKTVLLLDRSLLSVPAERPTEELCFRIAASPWMRRVWTLQEGALAKSFSVQFADRAIHAGTTIESLFRRAQRAECTKITLLESCSAMQHVQRCGSDDSEQLADMLASLRHRSTSHPEDKQICFAIMIRCDMNRIMDAEGDVRTQRIYQQLKYIPRGCLWQRTHPRLEISGFRWAPKDLFSIHSGGPEDGLALSDRGLLVSAHGMVYFGRSHYMDLSHRDRYYMSARPIRDSTSGKLYFFIFDVAALKSDAPWTTMGIILERSRLPTVGESGAVIRLDRNPSVASSQELSNYVRRCDRISGEYVGRAYLTELDQSEITQFEQDKEAIEKAFGAMAEAIRNGEQRLEDLPERERHIIEEGDNSWLMFEGQMLGSEQKWCVT